MIQRKAKRGEATQFLKDSLGTVTDDCIVWPFGGVTSSSTGNRYGAVEYKGRSRTAHRVALILHTGEDPPELEACHAPIVCHNTLCINVKHLRWDTPTANSLDRRLDGTAVIPEHKRTKGTKHHNVALTEDQVLAIAADTETSNSELGRIYGVHHSTIQSIRTGRTWSWLTNQPKDIL